MDEPMPIGMLGWSPPAEMFGADFGGVAPVRWNVVLLQAAMEAGILYEGARFELIGGQLLQPAERPSPRYYCATERLRRALQPVFGARCSLIRRPLHLSDDTEVEPELLVTRLPLDSYYESHPGPDDAVLVGEVGEGAREFVLRHKANLYARFAIRDYWVADLMDLSLWVHREPTAEGYRRIKRFVAGDYIAALAAPDSIIAVSDLLLDAMDERQ
jgi:hypothetical protein